MRRVLTAKELYNSRPFNEILIQFHLQDKLKGMIDINSDDYPVHFVNMDENGHSGLQCNFEHDDPRYKQYWDLCSRIIDAVREIDKLHSENNTQHG